jgi:phage terminase large subunit GpA-like protein
VNTLKQKHAQTQRILRDSLRTVFHQPDPLSVWEWAEKRRRMPKGITARPGPYSIAGTPFMREVQEAFFAPDVQTTVLCMASRTGKTETEMNLTGYTIDHDPCNILWVYPTLDSAKKWSKEFFMPMMKASKCFAGKLRKVGTKDADNTLLSKAFPGGRVSAIGANSPSGFRQIQAPRVICEEVDAMVNGEEGDPVELAFKRADNYADNVQIVSSTPTIKGQSRIWKWLEQSDFRKWFCPCQKCGHRQVWMWANVKWPEGKPEAAYLACESCGHAHDDEQREASVRAGEWRPTLPFTGVRGYWLNGINSLFPAKKGFVSKLHQFASEFLSAKEKGRDAIKTWTNTFLSECYEEDNEGTIQPKTALDRCEHYTPDALPNGVLLLVASGDVQNNRIEVEVGGFGADEESWGVQKDVIWGDPGTDDPWRKLDDMLLAQFRRADGVELKIERTFIDMKFAKHQLRVLDFCAPRLARGVFPCFGVNRVGNIVPPLLPAKPSRNNKRKIPHWPVGVTVAKSAIYDRLMLEPGEPRSMHFPHGFGYDETHFKQLTSEVRKTRYSHGQAYSIFEKPNESTRNEALDLAVYRLAALHSLFPIGWTKLAENRLAQRPAAEAPAVSVEPDVHPTLVQTPPVAAPQPVQRIPRPRRNWVTGAGW